MLEPESTVIPIVWASSTPNRANCLRVMASSSARSVVLLTRSSIRTTSVSIGHLLHVSGQACATSFCVPSFVVMLMLVLDVDTQKSASRLQLSAWSVQLGFGATSGASVVVVTPGASVVLVVVSNPSLRRRRLLAAALARPHLPQLCRQAA